MPTKFKEHRFILLPTDDDTHYIPILFAKEVKLEKLQWHHTDHLECFDFRIHVVAIEIIQIGGFEIITSKEKFGPCQTFRIDKPSNWNFLIRLSSRLTNMELS